MWQTLRILIGAGLTAATATAAGKLLMRRLALRLSRIEESLLAFVLGSGCLSVLVFLLASCGLARRGVFIGCGAILIGLCLWDGRGRATGDRLPEIPRLWKLLFFAVLAFFSVFYLLHAMAPECSPEGSGVNLPLIIRYARDYGFVAGLDAHSPQGLNMLFLFAFTIGRHSAAALFHLAFLVTLPLLMLSYGRRMGFPRAGVLGTIFTFASPVVGVDGSSAASEVALATVAFALFYLLQIWDSERQTAWLVPIGMLAGWAGGIGLAGLAAAPFALVFLAWKLLRARAAVLRPLVVTALGALVMLAPWFVRNPTWPAATVRQSYNSIQHLLEIPLQTTILGGPLGGLTGPLFLLAPVALITLRRRAGRQLLLAAAVFAATYPLDIATRFLIPSLPFVSLAMGLAFADGRVLGPLLVCAHLFLSYPKVMTAYCDPNAWRIETVQMRAALRRQPEEAHLTARLPDYRLTQVLDQYVPRNGQVFTQRPIPLAYTSRDVLIADRSPQGLQLREILRTPLVPAKWPVRHQRFRFPSVRLRGLRVLQTATGCGEWIVYELRLFRQDRELPRASQWRLSAQPHPEDVTLAFDNNPVTGWRSGGDLQPGMCVEVDLRAPVELDGVLLESCPEQGPVQLRLQGQLESGAWRDMAAAAETHEILRPAGLRRFAAREFKARGIEYLLTSDSDIQAADFREKPVLWGITELARSGNARLYRVR
jgi:hypothetical protein